MKYNLVKAIVLLSCLPLFIVLNSRASGTITHYMLEAVATQSFSFISIDNTEGIEGPESTVNMVISSSWQPDTEDNKVLECINDFAFKTGNYINLQQVYPSVNNIPFPYLCGVEVFQPAETMKYPVFWIDVVSGRKLPDIYDYVNITGLCNPESGCFYFRSRELFDIREKPVLHKDFELKFGFRTVFYLQLFGSRKYIPFTVLYDTITDPEISAFFIYAGDIGLQQIYRVKPMVVLSPARTVGEFVYEQLL
ncbi:hypothetical protein ACWJJH_05045 [Endozoicomonadaceae bacterium StTr2]